ncbi:hypothetical protein chiPu_0023680 [Chiloscyllium punctatum]|uniref:Uncharacterized protein n=1 Tax=Chiloscyllium punctatum TaxID=137246 RepID=A0A401TA67_CHIPU|nr:hypothetical protein [Chiloscyllium punctatum]
MRGQPVLGMELNTVGDWDPVGWSLDGWQTDGGTDFERSGIGIGIGYRALGEWDKVPGSRGLGLGTVLLRSGTGYRALEEWDRVPGSRGVG